MSPRSLLARSLIASSCVLVSCVGFATAVVCSACSSKSTSGTETACEPLTAAAVTLPAVIGIGKDRNGVLYVAAGLDQGTFTPRVFVLESGQLREQRILGSGGGAADFNVTFVDPGSDPSTGRNLLAHLVNGKATAMALGTPSTKGFIGDPSEASDETLALQDASVIAGLSVLGLPLAPEHIATVDDGSMLVVLQGASSTALATRVFYGTSGGTLFERKVIDVGAESQDEGILFDVDGATWSVNFHYQPLAKGNEGGTTQLITGKLGNPSGTHTLTILPSTTSLSAETFECLSGS